MAVESSWPHRFESSESIIRCNTEPISHPEASLKSGEFSEIFNTFLLFVRPVVFSFISFNITEIEWIHDPNGAERKSGHGTRTRARVPGWTEMDIVRTN